MISRGVAGKSVLDTNFFPRVCLLMGHAMDVAAVSWGTNVGEASTGPFKGFLMGGEGAKRNRPT